jgi:hypothetical protein
MNDRRAVKRRLGFLGRSKVSRWLRAAGDMDEITNSD